MKTCCKNARVEVDRFPCFVKVAYIPQCVLALHIGGYMIRVEYAQRECEFSVKKAVKVHGNN